MSQATTWGVPQGSPATPSEYAARDQESFDALLTLHSGDTRPAYLTSGVTGLWIDTSTSPAHTLTYWDGASDIQLLAINTDSDDVTIDISTLAAAVSANRFLARASTGDFEEKEITDVALDFLAAADEAAMRDVLGIATSPDVAGGRLTLTSGTPVTATDVTGATNIYYTPHKSSFIALYDTVDAAWKSLEFSETTLAIGTVTSGKNYDIFAYNNSGTLALEKVAWTSDSARATALVRQNGVWVKSGDASRRYVGSFRSISTTQTADTIGNRCLFNADNRVDRVLAVEETTANWSQDAGAWQLANSNANNCVKVLIGLAEDAVSAHCYGAAVASAGGPNGSIGIGINTTSTNSARGGSSGFSTSTAKLVGSYHGVLPVGYNTLNLIEFGSTHAGTTTWYGGTFPSGEAACGLSCVQRM